MTRHIGTVSMGIRLPIIKAGDDLISIITESLACAKEERNITFNKKDVVCITESLLARNQNNYAGIEAIAKDINSKSKSDEIAVLFPILSRNRFSIMLKAMALTGKKLHIFLSYPQDEVGNHIMDEMDLFNSGINPYTDMLSEDEFKEKFGIYKHEFTGIDYVALYKNIAQNSEIHFTNNPLDALKFTKDVIVASIHTREIVKRQLKENGANVVLGLDDILTESIDNSGYNPQYGLLGSNLTNDDTVKLFPRDCNEFVENLKKRIDSEFDNDFEVMVYGDGAFKDPVGKIWELADPVVSPGFTDGLKGTPNEIKIKYVADNELDGVNDMDEAIREKIRTKKENLVGENITLGTTPRQITDLLGSLCDLTSGSGDKGTPVVLIQGYFDNYADE